MNQAETPAIPLGIQGLSLVPRSRQIKRIAGHFPLLRDKSPSANRKDISKVKFKANRQKAKHQGKSSMSFMKYGTWNIRNLDYQNQKLMNIIDFAKTHDLAFLGLTETGMQSSSLEINDYHVYFCGHDNKLPIM